jgi:hypothetical protein
MNTVLSSWLFKAIGAAGAAAVVALNTVSPVAATSPTVVYSTALKAYSFPGPWDGSFATIVTLQNLPAGTWMLVFTGDISQDSGSASVTGTTTCRIAHAGSTIDQATWHLTAQADGRGREAIYLTGLYSNSSTSNVTFDCASTSTFHSFIVVEPAFVAMKGFASGTTSPRIFSLTHDAVVDVPAGTSFHSVANLSLGAGRYWIVAKTNVTDNSTSATDNVTCKLAAGKDVDQTGQSLYYQPQQGSTGEIALQTAHSFGSAGKAQLLCKGGTDTKADHIRIIAMKIGKLTRASYDSGVTSVAGSGTPTVETIYQQSSVPVSTSQFEDVYDYLPAGNWVVEAKAFLKDGKQLDISCTLEVGSTTILAQQTSELDGAPAGGLTGMYGQVAVHLTSTQRSDFFCGPASSTGASISYMRLTEISASSVTSATLP